MFRAFRFWFYIMAAILVMVATLVGSESTAKIIADTLFAIVLVVMGIMTSLEKQR